MAFKELSGTPFSIFHILKQQKTQMTLNNQTIQSEDKLPTTSSPRMDTSSDKTTAGYSSDEQFHRPTSFSEVDPINEYDDEYQSSEDNESLNRYQVCDLSSRSYQKLEARKEYQDNIVAPKEHLNENLKFRRYSFDFKPKLPFCESERDQQDPGKTHI